MVGTYAGLAAFTAAQARFLFGCDDDTRRVGDRLDETCLVGVVVGSGTGKASLVTAGVVPALQQQHPWSRFLRCKPQDDPSARLGASIDRHTAGRVLFARPTGRRADRRGTCQASAGRHAADPLRPVRRSVHASAADEGRSVSGRARRTARAVGRTDRPHAAPRIHARPGGLARGRVIRRLALVARCDHRRSAPARAIIVEPAGECGVAVGSELLAELLPAGRPAAA